MALNTSNINATNSGQTNNTNDTNNTAGSGAIGGVTPSPNPNENLMVRIDENSNEDLQALFDSVLRPSESRRPLQVPLRMRKLPDSFFKPPSSDSKSPSVSVSHTRENSADSAFGSGTNTICSTNGGSNNGIAGVNMVGMNVANRLQISHSRAHSSPASLQQTYAGLKTQQSTNPVVAAAVAAANTNNASNTNSNSPSLMAQQQNQQQQQQQAVVNNANQTLDSATMPIHFKCKSDIPKFVQQRQSQDQQVEFGAQQPNHARHRSFDRVSSIQLRDELGDLPPGWEMTRTAEGQIYYLE